MLPFSHLGFRQDGFRLRSKRKSFLFANHWVGKALVFAVGLVLADGNGAGGFVDEAHSIIMQVAKPYMDDGFTLRADYWHGKTESAKQRLVRHQLFRGNEYWFWAATSMRNCKISIEVYNSAGEAVSVEKKQNAQWASSRVTPAQTGSYYILVKVESLTQANLDWALVYGYR